MVVEIIANSTPRKEDVLKSLNIDEKLGVVRKISCFFGERRFLADVLVYKDEKSMKATEIIPKKLREKIEEEKKSKAKYSSSDGNEAVNKEGEGNGG